MKERLKSQKKKKKKKEEFNIWKQEKKDFSMNEKEA